MQHLTPHDVMTMFMALATLLGCAKVAAELMQKIRQPSILGEIGVGILLGPTVLGHYQPHLYETLFPTTGPMPIVLDTVTTLGVVFFLLTAGLEIDLRSIFRQGKAALLVSVFGVAFPFAAGFLAAEAFPEYMGAVTGADTLIFSLFVGTALSISALPVIAKILMDLNLLRTEMGTVIISSAMFDDLVGWILFSFVLGMMHPAAGSGIGDGVKHTIVLVVLFVGLTLTLGRWLIDKILPFLQAHTTWPGGVLGFIFTLTLAGAAFTEYAGIHAVFGAFVIGIAIGELRTNFVSNFHLGLTATVIGVACVGKLLGAGWGARLGGMDRTSSLAVGLAMNARGAMEIILGILALQAGLIRDNMFVAMVTMALFTSLLSAPAIHFLVSRRRMLTLKDTVTAKLFLPNLAATTRLGALREMCEVAAEAVSNAPERLYRLVSEREQVLPSGWENELAVPNARIDGLARPLVVVAKSAGIDFDARDGKPARLIIMILTADNQSQHDLLGDASQLFSRKEAVDRAVNAQTFVELVAALNAPVQ
jgi:Kef-type K+ transport system membrane component KefB/mannitol/fructose-specific phosphotransferase system IIA component (Ntr-type)